MLVPLLGLPLQGTSQNRSTLLITKYYPHTVSSTKSFTFLTVLALALPGLPMPPQSGAGVLLNIAQFQGFDPCLDPRKNSSCLGYSALASTLLGFLPPRVLSLEVAI